MAEVNYDAGNAVADAALGAARTPLDPWLALADPLWQDEAKGGSSNHDMRRNAAALWWDAPRRSRWVDAWHALFARERERFQRNEPRSPIYSGWHLIPVLLVYRWAVQHGDVILRAAARAWLENFWCMVALVAARTRSGKPVLALAGMRGTEFALDADWSQRNAWREALGDEGWPHRGEYDREQVNSWCDAAVAALSQEIRFTAADAVYAYRTGTEQAWRDLIAAAPKFGARGVGHILRTTGGVVCWNDADINGNTAALMAMKCEGGDLASLPPNGGERLRANSHAVIAEIGDALHYTSPLLGVHSMPLPPGELVYRVRIAEDGWRVTWPEPVPAPAPPEPPTPAPPVPPPTGRAGPGRLRGPGPAKGRRRGRARRPDRLPARPVGRAPEGALMRGHTAALGAERAGARGNTGAGEIAPQGPDMAQGGAVRAAVLYLRALGQTLRLPALVEAGDAIGRGDHLRWAEARRAELEED